jgi:hypothetical protein
MTTYRRPTLKTAMVTFRSGEESISSFSRITWRELGDSGEAEPSFRTEAERHSGMIPNTIGA